VILPDTLAPLPVTSPGEIAAGEEDFVLPGDVRRVLLGEVSSAPVAGRWVGGSASPVKRDLPRTTEDAALPAFEGQGIHPAFERPPTSRRAAPPRVAADPEDDFGRSPCGDRWWVFGMGLAAAALLFSGVVVDFISREAVRRCQFALPLPPSPPAAPAGARPGEVDPPAPESFAATSDVAREP